MPVLLPPVDEQARIVAKVDDHLSMINRLEAAILALQKCANLIRLETLNRAFQGTLPGRMNANNSTRFAHSVGKLQLDGKCAERLTRPRIFASGEVREYRSRGDVKLLVSRAGSDGRCNTCLQSTRWSLES